MSSSSEARKERIGAFAHIATMGLFLFGTYEAAPILFGGGETAPIGLADRIGRDIDRVPWLPVAAGASLLPAIVEATRRIPRRVGIPRIVPGSWKVPIGRSWWGRQVYFDFGGVIPHSIVAGATKFGKTAFIRTVLYVLCQQQSERNLQIDIVDLKGGASFAAWRNVPHVMSVERDLEGALKVLTSAEEDMWNRLDVIAAARGTFQPVPKFPHRLIVIDEGSLLKLDDMCMEILGRIAAIGREPNCHLLFGTQRPSADILPVVIRDQMEGRFVFNLNEPGSSRVVLGEHNTDAYRLSSRPGRMIHRSADGEVELQAAYVPEDVIIEWIRGFVKDDGPSRQMSTSVDASYVEVTHQGRRFVVDTTPPEHAPNGVLSDPVAVSEWD